MEPKEEVNRLVNLFQNELRSVYRNYSRSSIVENVWQILFVSKGIRCACLFTKIQCDSEIVFALKKVLIDYKNVLIIFIHHDSNQTFIVNRSIFHHRMEKYRSHQSDIAYLRVDKMGKEEEIQKVAPIELPSMLEQILNESEKYLDDQKDVQIILLKCGEALTGVGLAGWFLEYSLIYFYESNSSTFSSTTSSLEDKYLLQYLQEEEESGTWNSDESSQQNNLSNKELTVFSVNLQESNQPESSINLIQFTIPEIVIASTCKAIGLKGDQSESIAKYLEEKFTSRMKGSNEFNKSIIHVTVKRIKLDRVAI